MFTVYIVLFVAVVSSTAAVEVSTVLGSIRGATLKSRLGKDFYAFRGIRYGKSPVGELRFKNPLPVDQWKPKVFDATDDGPMCPQFPFNSTDNSEDCLRLNVYSKSLDRKAMKPVLIYIHTGGFVFFSGQSKNFAGPQLLMDRDIVFITINYRLGALGFLATGTADAPGNAGLKDQVVALKWVRDHIRNFGGDPNSVTLLGYSAGSSSVGLHMASPMSRGLFHRGIAMSSSPVSQERYPYDQLDTAKKQAELVKCPTNNVADMVKCLRKTSVEDFVTTQMETIHFSWYPLLNWMPVIEKDLGQERFIIEDPTISYQAGRIQRTPLIVGMTKDEFVEIAYSTLRNETETKQLNDNWDQMAPICFKYELHPNAIEISTVLRKEYLNNKPLRLLGPFDELGELFNDGFVKFGVHRLAHLAARYVPVYYYQFSYKGRYSHFTYPGDTRTVHHDDLLYLLYMPAQAPLFTKSDPEDTTIERLTRMFTQFAKTSDPNKRNDEYLRGVRWQPLNLKKENYLDIGSELITKESLRLDRFEIWERLFPLSWTGHHCKHGQGNLNYPQPDEPRRH